MPRLKPALTPPLRVVLPAGLALLVLGTIAAVTLPLAQRVGAELDALEREAQQRHARAVATELDNYLADRVALLTDHSWHPAVLAAVLDIDHARFDALDALHQMTMMGGRYPLSIYTRDGLRTHSTEGSTAARDLPEAITREIVLDRRPFAIEAAIRDEVWYWKIGVPVVNRGEPVGILAALIPVADGLRQQFPGRDDADANFALFSRGRTIAAVGDASADDGKATTSHPLTMTDATVVDRVPHTRAMLAKQRTFDQFGLALAVATPIALVLAYLLAKWVVIKPVGRLLQLVRSLDDDEADAGITGRSQFREVRRVEDAFHTMARSVRERETSLRSLAHTLEQRVEKRTRQFEQAAAEAEAASRAKSAFLANMSHEIRTPMTAILGYTDLVAEAAEAGRPAEESLEFLHTVQRNGKHLLAIINDVLDLSKIEAEQMTVERVPTNPVEVIQEVVSLIRPRTTEKGIDLDVRFESDMPVTIMTDPLRLRQIVVNLVGNAVKFTEEGAVTIAVRADFDVDVTSMRIDVEDTGIGMSREQMARIFDAFSQADASTTRKFGGSGLGLAISKRLAGMLGGGISAFSTPGQGSTFSVTIDCGDIPGVPIVPAEHILEAVNGVHDDRADDPAHSDEPALPLSCLRILLVEDGPDNRRLIAHHLRKAGAEVTLAEDGKLGVEALTEDGTLDGPLARPAPVDFVISDMQMPVMDGYEATRLLRKKGCDLPIIALTAHAMRGDDAECFRAGCDGYATKPIDREALIETCLAAVDRRSNVKGNVMDQADNAGPRPERDAA